MVSYTLTGIKPHISCFGTSFKSIEEAKDYALKLQSVGLCESYSIGEYTYEGHKEVFHSDKDRLIK